MRRGVHEGLKVAGEEVVVHEEVIGEVLVSTIPWTAGEIISKSYSHLDRG